MKTCMLYVTVGTSQEARNIAKTLVSEHLVACVNVIENVTSIYRWDNEIQEDSECLLFAKTALIQRDAAMNRVKELHSYDTPCVVAYDTSAGLPGYLSWIISESKVN